MNVAQALLVFVLAAFDDPIERLPVALSSPEWYSGKLQHLSMAWIETGAPRP